MSAHSALQFALTQAKQELGEESDTLKLIERTQEILREPPTDRQMVVLRLIDSRRRRDGHAPTIRELGEALNTTSTNGTADHLKALQKRGLVTWQPNRARTLALTAQGLRWLGAA